MEKLKKGPVKLPKIKEVSGWKTEQITPMMTLNPQILSPFTVKSKKEFNISPRYPKNIKLPTLYTPTIAEKPEDLGEYLLETKLYEIDLPETEQQDSRISSCSKRSRSSKPVSALGGEYKTLQSPYLELPKSTSAAYLFVPGADFAKSLNSSRSGKRELSEREDLKTGEFKTDVKVKRLEDETAERNRFEMKDVALEGDRKDTAEIEASERRIVISRCSEEGFTGTRENFEGVKADGRLLGAGYREEGLKEGLNAKPSSLVLSYPTETEFSNETIRVLNESSGQSSLSKLNYDLLTPSGRLNNRSAASQNLLLDQKMRFDSNSFAEEAKTGNDTLPCEKNVENKSFRTESEYDISLVEVLDRKLSGGNLEKGRWKSEIYKSNHSSEKEEVDYVEEELRKYPVKYEGEKRGWDSGVGGVISESLERDESVLGGDRNIIIKNLGDVESDKKELIGQSLTVITKAKSRKNERKNEGKSLVVQAKDSEKNLIIQIKDDENKGELKKSVSNSDLKRNELVSSADKNFSVLENTEKIEPEINLNQINPSKSIKKLISSKKSSNPSKKSAKTSRNPTKKSTKPNSKKNPPNKTSSKKSPASVKAESPSKLEKILLYNVNGKEMQISIAIESEFPSKTPDQPSPESPPKPKLLDTHLSSQASPQLSQKSQNLRSSKASLKPHLDQQESSRSKIKKPKISVYKSNRNSSILNLLNVLKNPVKSFIHNSSVSLLVNLKKQAKSLKKSQSKSRIITKKPKNPQSSSHNSINSAEKSLTSNSINSTTYVKSSLPDLREKIVSSSTMNLSVKSGEEPQSAVSLDNQDRLYQSKASVFNKYKRGSKHYVKKLEISLKSKNSTIVNKDEESESSSFSYEGSESLEEDSDLDGSESEEESLDSFDMNQRLRSSAMYELENFELIKSMVNTIFESNKGKKQSLEKNVSGKLDSVMEIDESRMKDNEVQLKEISKEDLEGVFGGNGKLIFFKNEEMDLANKKKREENKKSELEIEMELRRSLESKKKFLDNYGENENRLRIAEYTHLQIIPTEEFITEKLDLSKNPRLLQIDECLNKKKKSFNT